MKPDTMGVALLSYAHTGHAVGYTRSLQRLAGAELLAVYDEEPERGQRFADRFGVPRFEQDLDRLLSRPDVQAVVVTGATVDHVHVVTKAAQAGKHVFCEKPLATRIEDARTMIAACQNAGVQLHVAFSLRFYPIITKVKQMLLAGEIGEVFAMVGGNRGIPPLPPAYPEWITEPEQAGGGALMDHSVHVTDAMRFLSGLEVTSVSAEAGAIFRPELAVDDAALLLLRFNDAMIASVDPSWSLPKAHPYHYDFFLRILGSEGVLTVDETRQSLQVTRTPGAGGDERGYVLEPFGADPTDEMLRHFLACARDGEYRPPAATGEDGLRALEIALAGYESARSGQPVTLVPAIS